MTKNRVFNIEGTILGSQTHPHVDTTMTSYGNFQPTLYMTRGRGDYAEHCFTWCVLWYHCTVAFHLAGVQQQPHLASGHVTLDAVRRTLFHESTIGSSQPLHISLPLHLHRTAEKSVHKTRSLSKACGVPSLQILYCMVPPSTQQTEVRLCTTITIRYGARGVVITYNGRQ